MTAETTVPVEEMEKVDIGRKREEEPDEAVDFSMVVQGPVLDLGKINEKKLKKVQKEGGKRGVEIEGAAAMGGLMFFCTAVDEPEGDIDLLTECMTNMNKLSDPSEEERKGGSGKIGKIILSCVDENLGLVAYVPSDKTEKCNAKEWLTHVCTMICDGPKNMEKMCTLEKCGDAEEKYYYRALCKKDGELGLFPIKMRDTAITEAYSYLKKRDLFPDGDDDEDDDYVFGDEDFP